MSVQAGDLVRISYVGRFESGAVFATSDEKIAAANGLDTDERECSPLSFTVGNEEVIAGLDKAVRGMTEGENATVTVPPADAYGEYDSDRVREYHTDTFEGMVGQQPEVGVHVEAENGLHGDVTAVSEDSVEVDFNHELAGKTLVFELTVLAVE